jgi:hypothetical protein
LPHIARDPLPTDHRLEEFELAIVRSDDRHWRLPFLQSLVLVPVMYPGAEDCTSRIHAEVDLLRRLTSTVGRGGHADGNAAVDETEVIVIRRLGRRVAANRQTRIALRANSAHWHSSQISLIYIV